MKKLAVLLSILFLSHYSFSSHLAGAQITYEHISGNTYQFALVQYVECTNWGGTVSLGNVFSIGYNSQSSGYNGSFNVIVSDIQEANSNLYCQSYIPLCPNSNVPGVTMWKVTAIGTYTLPQAANDWHFTFTFISRVNTTATSSGTPMFIDAWLDNTSYDNSAIYYDDFAVTCSGQLTTIDLNQYITNPDNDYLNFSLVSPRTAYSTNLNFNLYSWGSPFPMNPGGWSISTNGILTIDATNTFDLSTVIAVQVNEYDPISQLNLKGQTTLDIVLNIPACSNNAPTLSGFNSPTSTNYTYEMCDYDGQVCLLIYSDDPDAGDNLTLTWSANIPGATFDPNFGMTSNGHPIAQFCWDPTQAQLDQELCFTVTATDDACPLPKSVTETYCIKGGCCASPQSTRLDNKSASWVINNILGGSNTWTTNNYITISGTFTVDQDFTFFNCPNITFENNLNQYSEIYINPGVTLTIEKSNLESCDEYLWQGITIPDNSAELTAIDSRFREAISAVTSILGGRFNLTRNTFEDNYIGVDMIFKTATQTFYNNGPTSSDWYFENNSFAYLNLNNNNGLLIPHTLDQSYCGIQISDHWDGINYNPSTAIQIDFLHHFERLEYGILLNRSNAYINYATFDFVQFGVKSIGFDMASNPNPPYLPWVVVSESFFNETQYTAQALYGHDFTFTWNDVTNGIVNTQDLYQSGSKLGIINNSMTFTHNVVPFGMAIVTFNNWETEIILIDNQLHLNHLVEGIYCHGGSPNNSYLKLERNLINEPFTFGMSYGGFSKPLQGYSVFLLENYVRNPLIPTGFSGGGFLNNMASIDKVYVGNNAVKFQNKPANTWGFNFNGSSDLVLECNTVDLGDVAFVIQSQLLNFEFEGNIVTNSNYGYWMSNSSIPSDIGSPTSPPDNAWYDYVSSLTYTFPSFVWDNTDAGLYTYFYRPIGNANMFEPLNMQAINGGIMPAINISSGPWVSCGSNYWKEIYPRMSADQIKFNLGQDYKAFEMLENDPRQIQISDKLYMKYLSGSIQKGFNNQMDNLIEKIEQSDHGMLLRSLHGINSMSRDEIKQSLNIAGSLDQDEYLKTIIQYYYYSKYEPNSIDEFLIESIKDIAKICPESGGISVFEARNILPRYTTKIFTSDCESFGTNVDKTGSSILSSSGLVLFPNPSEGIINVQSLNLVKSVEVIDLNGKSVYQNFNVNGYILEIDLSDHPNGIYLVKVLSSDGKIDSRKIVKH